IHGKFPGCKSIVIYTRRQYFRVYKKTQLGPSKTVKIEVGKKCRPKPDLARAKISYQQDCHNEHTSQGAEVMFGERVNNDNHNFFLLKKQRRCCHQISTKISSK
ncbi:Hypothetical predicted protein, partial [Paramuricea clavata]